MIDARALHGWLGVKDRFATWMRRRIGEYGFTAGDDYFAELRKITGRGRRRRDYLLTLDMAKELAMVERTEIGRETRRAGRSQLGRTLGERSQLALTLGGKT
jgi:phage anti-repressor protein